MSYASWLGNYRYRRKITVDHTLISADLTDFPLLIYITEASGKTNVDLAGIPYLIYTYGYRIAVTIADGVTQLPVEVEPFEENAAIALWTKVPFISKDTDTILYIYYDNTQPPNATYVGAIGSAIGQSVWDNIFQGVYHLSEETDVNAVDSTSNANNGSNTGVTEYVPANICMCSSFPAATAKIDLGNPAGFDQPSIMVEAWIFTGQNYIEDGRIVTVGSGATNKWLLTMNVTSNKAVMSNTDASHSTPASDNALNDSKWYHIVGTTNPEAIYVNGVLQSATKTDSWSFEANSKIGSRGTARQFIGFIDEVRVSNTNRGTAYITASYESQRDNLVTYDAEETYPYGMLRVTRIRVIT